MYNKLTRRCCYWAEKIATKALSVTKAYDKVLVRFPKGKKDIIKAHAEAHSESVNGFINRAIDEAIERDESAPAASDRQREG